MYMLVALWWPGDFITVCMTGCLGIRFRLVLDYRSREAAAMFSLSASIDSLYINCCNVPPQSIIPIVIASVCNVFAKISHSAPNVTKQILARRCWCRSPCWCRPVLLYGRSHHRRYFWRRATPVAKVFLGRNLWWLGWLCTKATKTTGMLGRRRILRPKTSTEPGPKAPSKATTTGRRGHTETTSVICSCIATWYR